MVLIDYSSAFNTVIPNWLSEKQFTLWLTPHATMHMGGEFILWLKVWFGMQASGASRVSTGIPQGCVLSPLLYTLWLHLFQDDTKIVKIAHIMTVIGLIIDEKETAYRRDSQPYWGSRPHKWE